MIENFCQSISSILAPKVITGVFFLEKIIPIGCK